MALTRHITSPGSIPPLYPFNIPPCYLCSVFSVPSLFYPRFFVETTKISGSSSPSLLVRSRHAKLLSERKGWKERVDAAARGRRRRRKRGRDRVLFLQPNKNLLRSHPCLSLSLFFPPPCVLVRTIGPGGNDRLTLHSSRFDRRGNSPWLLVPAMKAEG